jgi:hypothetical protein
MSDLDLDRLTWELKRSDPLVAMALIALRRRVVKAVPR